MTGAFGKIRGLLQRTGRLGRFCYGGSIDRDERRLARVLTEPYETHKGKHRCGRCRHRDPSSDASRRHGVEHRNAVTHPPDGTHGTVQSGRDSKPRC